MSQWQDIVVDHVSEITLSRPILESAPKVINECVIAQKRSYLYQGMRMKESVIDPAQAKKMRVAKDYL